MHLKSSSYHHIFPVASPRGGMGVQTPHFCSDPSWDLRKSVEKCFKYRGGPMHVYMYGTPPPLYILHWLPPPRNRAGKLLQLPPSNSGNSSTTPPPPRNSAGKLFQLPPSNSGNSSTTPKLLQLPPVEFRELIDYPPSKFGRKTPSTTPPPEFTELHRLPPLEICSPAKKYCSDPHFFWAGDATAFSISHFLTSSHLLFVTCMLLFQWGTN